MAKYGSDIFVDLLEKLKIEYVAFNPGSTLSPIQESLVNNSSIKLITCLHEEIAVAVAHGYAKAAQKPMIAAVHANVGLMHASMAVYNAWCDRIPMVVVGGVGPQKAEDRRPWIDWIHASSPQSNIVQDYVKWFDQPTSMKALIDSTVRCYKLSMQKPSAPCYLSVSTSLQELEYSGFDTSYKFTSCLQNNKAVLSDTDIEAIGGYLLNAENPVLVVDAYGPDKSSVSYLIMLCELLGIAVIDIYGRFNFPSANNLSVVGENQHLLSKADFVLALDVQDVYSVLGQYDINSRKYIEYNPKSDLVHIGMNSALVSCWAADYHPLVPRCKNYLADSSESVKKLYMFCKEHVTHSDKYTKRSKAVKKIGSSARDKWIQQAKSCPDEYLNIQSTIYHIWGILEHENFILSNCGGLAVRDWVKKIFRFDNINTHFVGVNSGGAGLGYGLGASIGVALAVSKSPDLVCINIQNDGDFQYTPSALWTMSRYSLPIVNIIMNNSSYGLSKKISKRLSVSRNRGFDTIAEGNDLDHPSIDYSKIASGYDIKSFGMAYNKAQLIETIQSALVYVKDQKKPCLIDVKIKD